MLRKYSRYVGIGLLSMATLMLQISYSRVLTVALWHHFIWMVVSIALLGYAASGTLMMTFPKLQDYDPDLTLTVTSASFSISIILSYWVLNFIPFEHRPADIVTAYQHVRPGQAADGPSVVCRTADIGSGIGAKIS